MIKSHKRTRKMYEQHLNNMYADSFGWEQVKENFSYFKCRESTLLSAYHNHQIGSLLRRHDPIAFNVGYNETNTKTINHETRVLCQ